MVISPDNLCTCAACNTQLLFCGIKIETGMGVYSTQGCNVDYRQLNDPPWPKEVANGRQKPKDKLYPIEIVKRDPNDASRVKIRYIGYSIVYDEWCNRSDCKSDSSF